MARPPMGRKGGVQGGGEEETRERGRDFEMKG
jgi:hypothetical protein